MNYLLELSLRSLQNKNSRKFTCSARGSATFVTSGSYTSCFFCGNTRRILGLAYLLNYSGVTYTLGLAFAATGVLFPFFASFIGLLGVALTGSDTSSNALFANLQKVTAQQIVVNPILTVGANSSGGVLGKMISPPNPHRRYERHGPAGQGGRPVAPGPEVVPRAHPGDGRLGHAPGLRAEVLDPVEGLF